MSILHRFVTVVGKGFTIVSDCCCSVTKLCLLLCDPPGLQPARSFAWNFTGKNTRVGCHFLLQGIFLTQGSNPCLLYCRWNLYHCTTWEAHSRVGRWPAGGQAIWIEIFSMAFTSWVILKDS